MEELKQLQEEFDGRGEVRGFHFKQLEKGENAYLYQVTHPLIKSPYYEVFKKVIHVRFGCIAYPKSGSFGTKARTTKDKELAYSIFEELNK